MLFVLFIDFKVSKIFREKSFFLDNILLENGVS